MANVIVLNENLIPSADMLRSLQLNVSADFYIPSSISEKRFQCFCRSPEFDLSEVHEGSRINVRKLKIQDQNALLVLVHGVDIRNNDLETRQAFAHLLASEMEFVKTDKNTNGLLLLGDFNMNPYDRGMTLATGLNAMMTRSCASKGRRHYMGKDYDCYYNPMWGLFGDNTKGPAGTVYDASNQGPYGWNMLDQVLIHHTLVPLFHDVDILTTTGKESLMNREGHPDAEHASDHFPILVNFKGVNHE